jgi:Zn-finger nucleic acid-binding protein
MTRCAKCPGTLIPAASSPSDSLGALQCSACGGLWLPDPRLVSLADATGLDSAPVADDGSDRRAGVCPRGHGLLARARVEGESFHLDRCPHCGGVWLDAGEWRALSSGFALANLERLWDPSWRRARSEEQAEKRRLEELREQLGAERAESLFSLLGQLEALSPRARSMVIALVQQKLG